MLLRERLALHVKIEKEVRLFRAYRTQFFVLRLMLQIQEAVGVGLDQRPPAIRLWDGYNPSLNQ